jgi:aminoglycoside phosphotransferase (APT) family kinase protein
MSKFDHFVGTKPVSDTHAFDMAALTAWMQQHVEGFAGPLQAEMFKG